MPLIVLALALNGGPAERWSDGILPCLLVFAAALPCAVVLRRYVELPAFRQLTGREPPLA